MSDTSVTNSSYDAQSTAWDMACMGQMIANRGAYGTHRFFAEATLEKRLPRLLTPQLGPGATKMAGIGCYWMNEPLGKRTIFHNAASSATICVDLDNDVVVSMSRPTAGKNFHTYHRQFMLAVRAGLVDPKNLTELRPQK
jgi:CubicO group peptidase (beta-lactamase class C family)